MTATSRFKFERHPGVKPTTALDLNAFEIIRVKEPWRSLREVVDAYTAVLEQRLVDVQQLAGRAHRSDLLRDGIDDLSVLVLTSADLFFSRLRGRDV